MNVPYTAPTFHREAFNCPYCNAFAKQQWSDLVLWNSGTVSGLQAWEASTCSNCNKTATWQNSLMRWPRIVAAPQPNPDLPAELQKDFEEARAIAGDSPRGAAALLRLVIQKLCKELGAAGSTINDNIADLVGKGLPKRVQQALDAVRVIGNEAVHPGEIDLRDDADMAHTLFGLVNFIAEKMITEAKEIDEIYATLPAGKRKAIEARDKKK